MLEEDYQEIKQTYGLPEFTDLEYEFDLLQADVEYPLKSVCKQMQDKLQTLIDILSDILQPTPESLSQMHEYSYIDDEQKHNVLKTYKSLNFLLRSIQESQLVNDPALYAETIKMVAQEWPALKATSLPVIKTIKESWKKEIVTTEQLGYFG